jgi:hypothetical protein
MAYHTKDYTGHITDLITVCCAEYLTKCKKKSFLTLGSVTSELNICICNVMELLVVFSLYAESKYFLPSHFVKYSPYPKTFQIEIEHTNEIYILGPVVMFYNEPFFQNFGKLYFMVHTQYMWVYIDTSKN